MLGRERADAAPPHASIGRHVEHRSTRPAHGTGLQAATDEKSQVEGAGAAGVDYIAGHARDADTRDIDHGQELARQRLIHQVTIGPGIDEE